MEPTHSASEQDAEFAPSENEALRSSLSMASQNAAPTGSVQKLPRGLVQDMIRRYDSKSVNAKTAWRTKPHPQDLHSTDAPSQDGLKVSEPKECNMKHFVTKTLNSPKGPTSSVPLDENNRNCQGVPEAAKDSTDERSATKSPLEPANSQLFDINSTLEGEAEYLSKTTIAKTDDGVRIIIDIYFDQVAGSSVISGNCIATHIPESRILNEFKERVEADKRKSAD